jgi:hypothetical protein
LAEPVQTLPSVRPTGPSGDYLRIGVDPGAFGARSAQALRAVGGATEQVGDVTANAAIRFQQIQNRTDVDAENNVFANESREILWGPNGQYNKKGKDALDGVNPTTKQLEDLRAKHRDSLKNPEAQRMFDTISRREMEMHLDRMAAHASSEYRTYRIGTAKGALTNGMTESGLSWNDPVNFARTLGNIRIQAENLARIEGRTDSEEIKADVAHYVGQAWVARIKGVSNVNPQMAWDMYQANAEHIQSPADRVVLEHELKSRLQPVEAKTDAETIMTGGKLNPNEKGPVMVPASVPGWPREQPSEALARAQTSLTLLQQEAQDRPNDPSLRREIQRTQQVIEAVGKGTPTAARDTRAAMASWLAVAENVAERRHPGDAVYRDMVINQIKAKVSTITSAQEGLQKQAHGALISRLAPEDGSIGAQNVDELLRTPEDKAAWALLDPAAKQSLIAGTVHNQHRAEGRRAEVNNKLKQDIVERFHLPEGDPNRIDRDTQLTQYIGQIGFEGVKQLKNELSELQSESGKNFSVDRQHIRNIAKEMLLRNMANGIQPDVAVAAAERFNQDFDKQIAGLKAQGKNEGDIRRALFDSDSKDWVLKAEHVQSFMPSARKVAGDKAREVMPPKDKMIKLDARDPDATWQSLAPGTWFVGPDGAVGRKAGVKSATQPAAVKPAEPEYAGFVKTSRARAGGTQVSIDAPARSAARALQGKTYATREEALAALASLYGGK